MTKPTTLEARRAAGEPVTLLPILVGGRPTLPEIARPPAGLDKYARAAWRDVAQLLVEQKLIDRVDRSILEGYAVQVGRARAIREEIEWEHEPARTDIATGQVLNPKTAGRRTKRRTLHDQLMARTTRGVSANPLLGHERDAWKEARLLALDLGLSPVSRTKLIGKRQDRGRGLAGLNADLPQRVPLAAVE